MAIRTAASTRPREDERASLVIRMSSPHPARRRRLIDIRRVYADLLAYALHLRRVVAARDCTIQLLPRQSNAATIPTACGRAICTTPVRTRDGGCRPVRPWAVRIDNRYSWIDPAITVLDTPATSQTGRGEASPAVGAGWQRSAGRCRHRRAASCPVATHNQVRD